MQEENLTEDEVIYDTDDVKEKVEKKSDTWLWATLLCIVVVVSIILVWQFYLKKRRTPDAP